MSINQSIVVMMCCDYSPEHLDLESDDLYADLDSYSTWRHGEITYLYDEVSSSYLYVGEVLAFADISQKDFMHELGESSFMMKDYIEEFCESKFGYNNEAKIRVFVHEW